MNIVVLGALASIVAVMMLVAVVLALMPSKPKLTATASDLAMPLAPVRYALEERSLRDRELDEDAAELANEFRRARRDRYLAALRQDASEYFAPSSTAAAKKSA